MPTRTTGSPASFTPGTTPAAAATRTSSTKTSPPRETRWGCEAQARDQRKKAPSPGDLDADASVVAVAAGAVDGEGAIGRGEYRDIAHDAARRAEPELRPGPAERSCEA